MKLRDKLRLLGCLFAVAVTCWPTLAIADYEASRRWFYTMDHSERGLLQSRLILLGQYNAVVDSEFGLATYRALTDFQTLRSDARTGILTPAALRDLDTRSTNTFYELGMEVIEDARGQLSLFVPKAVLSETETTRRGTAYFDPSRAIRLETINKPYIEESYESLYTTLIAESPVRKVTYNIFNSQRFVVSGTRADFPFYIFMHSTPTASIGFSMEWDREVDAVGGMLATFMASHSYPLLETSNPPTIAEATQQPSPQAPPRLSYGTGFFVAENGVLVTNHHVVERCSAINIPGYGQARMVTGDAGLDLAVLRLADNQPHGVAAIRNTEVELGEEVVLLGFPLAPVLNSSLSVGTGIVSGETGLRGEQRWFTTSVGIQPGNSGGPLLDEYGQVVGVAVAKMDELALLNTAGTVAPNVGFAIKTGPLLDYLSIFRLSEPTPRGERLPVRASVELARQFTVQVVCEPADH